MSKRAFKKYIKSLEKEDLEEQIMDLYNRFEDVKVFYNFVFNPNEEKLVNEAKFKISKEYFPPNKRKAKARRSVAHKYIKHFKKLEMEPHSLADLMFYNVEIAQTFSADKDNITEAFEKSIFKSQEQAVNYVIEQGILPEFLNRIQKINAEAVSQNWSNSYLFERINDQFL
ncbi:DUF6155 family protein [Christiangramia salexigens]|uniref:Uncharacterized protein n=1 Tax=Christiangramia salexigens TaxID=1913577 RepID=A0A1L3J3B8_9FLAO|nr:DUF6155 family protein [Christiangramia salexigens]APG59603.1 hypothetical protein LPB144_03895 [Christiangramia salexigens]